MGKHTLDFPKKFVSDIEFKIIIPSTRNINKPINTTSFKKRINQAIRFLSTRFGGSTIDQEIGAYKLKGKIIREKVAIITVNTTKTTYNQHDQTIATWLKAKKKAWGQHSMAIIYKGKMALI